MIASPRQKVEVIPIDHIRIPNPRSRNKRQHREIVENIQQIGLKRPITVNRRLGSDPPCYDLVCGQGRLEALRTIGETEIPAVVIQADEEDCLVMSLVENIARRQHRPIEIMREIGSLHERGYSEPQIATKIGVTSEWVGMIVKLLENGEERLVAAVETGLIPISFAVDIARADHAEVQNVLMDAYASGKIKGKKLNKVRNMLDQRVKNRTTIANSKSGRKKSSRKITSTELLRIYEREAEKQRILVKKSDYTQSKLLFIIEALKDLLSDDGFQKLLTAEGLDMIPRALAARIAGESLA